MFRSLFLNTPQQVDRRRRRMFAFFVWVLLYTVLFIPWLGNNWKLVLSVPALEIFDMVTSFVVNDKVLTSLLQKKQLAYYVLLIIILIGGISYITGHIEIKIISYFCIDEPYKPHQLIIKNSVLMIYSVFISTITTLALRDYDDNEAHTKLLAEKNEMELRFLKMQINPHFLFNALNNIYSMSVTEDKNSPEAIMRLSSMLRYILDNNSGFVNIEQEVEHLTNFIEFQKLCSENEDNISFESSVTDKNIKIPSMLLQPLVENCFKHGKTTGGEAVSLSLVASEGKIYFTTSNKISSNIHESKSGIGLQNVIKRLELYYPNNFSLVNTQENAIFVIKLMINTKTDA
ncbi:MAG: sensor histidine kinase [Rikenellaceae bacterium]